MVFKIYAEDADQNVLEYTVTMKAGYPEIEDASKKENFIKWVVENATSIKGFRISDFTSNDFLETILCDGDKKLATYYIASGDTSKLLLEYLEDDF